MNERDPTNGQFLPGNRFWAARSTKGPKPKFETAEALWEAAVEYFDWCHDNPLYEDKLVTFQGSATHEPVAKLRAMTIRGLCLFLDISDESWRCWKIEGHELHKPYLVETMARIEAVIFTQKFEGAAADLLNQSIIARELGLAEKTELTGKDGGPIQTITNEMTPQEAAEAYAATLHRDKG